MTETKPIIDIVNVVASASIDETLDLVKIQKKIPTIEYNPEQFPGAVFRLQNPKTATLLFRTGKMVCTG
ncbi:MAG: TATA box-binding protein, partial [Nitrosopumilus sp.]